MRIAVQPAGIVAARPVTLSTASPSTAPAIEVKGRGISGVLLAGAALPTVYKGGTYLIDKANSMTPQDLAGVLESHHLVTNPDAALQQAHSFLVQLQSKGGNALLIGGVAGALAATVVDLVKPDWPIGAKLGVGSVVLVLVAGLLYWGLTDKPSGTPEAPKAEQSAKP
jgi:hypothetical protein